MKIFRIILASLCVIAAFFSVPNSVASIADLKAPDIALKMQSGHSRALARKAELLIADKNKPENAKARDLAVRSLRQTVINPTALRVFAQTGAAAQRNNLLLLSEKMSRRDVFTQLLLSDEDAVNNRLSSVLVRYDTVLRTSGYARGFLFERLSYALVDPQINRAFSQYIKDDPIWMGAYVDYAINQNVNLDKLAQSVVTAGGFKDNEKFANASQNLISALAAGKHLSILKEFYLTLPSANPAVFSTVAFDAAATAPQFSPLTWRIENSTDASSSFDQNGEGGFALISSIEDGQAVVVAEKLLTLQPGRYRFAMQFEMLEGNPSSRVIAEAQCVSKQATSKIGEVIVLNNAAERQLSFDLNVNGGCAWQLIQLKLGNGDNGSQSTTVKFTNGRISPIGS